MGSNVSPTGSTPPSIPTSRIFSPEVKKKAQEVLKGAHEPKESNIIEERLQGSNVLDELAAGIPGAPNLPETEPAIEADVKGRAVIDAGNKAKESILKKVPGGIFGGHTVEENPSDEKMKKPFPR
jgi:hypothetical protein